MSSKKQAHTTEAGSKQQPHQPSAKSSGLAEQQTHPATLIQRASVEPKSLTPQDVLQLQRMIGNHATSRLLTLTPQRQPIHVEPNRTGMPDNLKAGVERLSGLSLDDVTVHYNSSKPAQLRALAYTQGSDIYIAPRQEKRLPHEAWHVVQQMQERVKPNTQVEGVAISDGAELEQEADVMGVKALQTNHTAHAVRAPTYQDAALSRQHATTKAAPDPVAQRISDFSRWFIEKILIPVLLEIKRRDQHLPEGFNEALEKLLGFLEVDDSKEPDWFVAVSALKSFIEDIVVDQNPHTIVFGVILVDKIEPQISSAAEELTQTESVVINHEKLLSYLDTLRKRLLDTLPDESESDSDDDESDSDDEMPKDLGTLFAKYPKITDPLRRPGHLNPYRHGIGAADTIAILSINRKELIARIAGSDSKRMAQLEAAFHKADQQIKAINDKEEKPILEQIAKLTQKMNMIIQKSGSAEVDTSEIEEEIAALGEKLLVIRQGLKKTYREQLRKLYDEVFWISQSSAEDVDNEARARQVKEFSTWQMKKGSRPPTVWRKSMVRIILIRKRSLSLRRQLTIQNNG